MLWVAIAVGLAIVFVLVAQRQPAAADAPAATDDAHVMQVSAPRPGDAIAPLPRPPTKPDLPPGMYTFGYIWRWEGGAWHLDTPPECEPITRIHGAGDGLWASSWKEIWQHTDSGWIRHAMPVRLFALHGWSADAFMVGGVRSVFRLEGGAFVPETTLPESISALWGPTADDVFAVGWGGMIMRGRGGQWAAEASGVSTRLTGVWGDADAIVVVGDEGVVLVSTGDGVWTREAVPEGDGGRALSFAGVWGDGAGTWYAVTDGGEILARRGGTWVIEHTVKWQLLGIQGCAARGEIWATGLQGQMFRSTGDGAWADLSGARSNSLHTAHRDGDRLWVGGDWFFEIAEQKAGVLPG